MFNGKKILAIIPARAGSKGLPSKNIKELGGKPLIAWTIEASLKSKYIDETIVSTDGEKIAEVARQFGAQVPFMRPYELSGDKSRSIDAVFHVLDNMQGKYDLVVFLQPTSPFRNSKDIDKIIEYMFEKQAESVVSVCECNHPPIWSNVLPDDKSMKDFIDSKYKNIPRQKVPCYYKINGAIYVGYSEYFKEIDGFIGEQTYAYVMSKDSSIDIDSLRDFQLAQIIIGEKNETTSRS